MSESKATLASSIPSLGDGFTLKFKSAFYECVPHLADAAEPKNNEIEIVCLSEKGKQFLSQEGEKFWHFKEVSLPSTIKARRFADFCAILKAQGQMEPIWVDEDGFVLDGYSRWFALIQINHVAQVAGEACVTPIVQILPKRGDDAATISWIRSRKLARHNLTEKQRMKIVTEEIKAHPERSCAWTAQLLGVSPQTVTNYRNRLERSGELTAHTELIGSDGRKVPRTPKLPLTEDELTAAKNRASERQQTKKDEVIQAFLNENEGLLLSPEHPHKTLQNVLRVVSENDFKSPALADTLNAVQQAITKQQEEGWQPRKIGKQEQVSQDALLGALCEQSSLDSLQSVAHYFGELVEAVGDGRIEADEQVEDGVINCIKAVIDGAQDYLARLTSNEMGVRPSTSVSASTMAVWNVKTVDVAKTKTGLSIKLKTEFIPATVDIVEQVNPGPVLVGGKTINFQAAKGLLLLPAKPESPRDATLSPYEDELSGTGT